MDSRNSMWITHTARWGVVTVLTVFGVLGLVSCGNESNAGVAGSQTPLSEMANSEVPGSGAEFNPVFQNLSPEGQRTLDDLRDRGLIRAAVIESPESYAPMEATEKQGFDYRLAQEFARTLGVTLDVNADYTVQEFFSRNGTIPEAIFTDPDLTYAPDGFLANDLFAAPLAIVPWRRQISRMVPIYPAGISIVGPRASSIRTEADLDGLTVAVIEGEFQISILESLMEEHGISIGFAYRDQAQNGYDFVRSGQADILLDGSIFVASGIEELAEMEVAPLSLSRVAVGWALPKENRGLYELLTKFIEHALVDGTVARIWEDTHDVAFETYIDLIGLE